MTDEENTDRPAVPTRAEAVEYKEQLGVVRTREEAEAIAAEENQ
ncbi:hypothetical protein TIN4_106 [Tsukamurella phage TIN4]|uniref:Uncharacterized protein n=2 Tax=Tinduovirus TIN3 TaxID=1982571 RepID=A0A0K0N6G3_9CAUD|nr:hypothetical protein AVT54_gp019 [Tsukamurella phage TIN3]YP_009604236.1 hypothetical protein FDH87_gp019 [Tsukamurella phage TIN4]AKJ71903.1 hypothetical protein TIN3_106 [Tsukamurella phage TIN3]AKJ72012.1 hypothetical protein TIN4_106 [Tsukamurella phage TIN4]